MALRVWLPLNGNLENKGISNITVTNNGATVNNNGKIGKCYSFNGSSNRISCSAITYIYPISISGWFKPADVTNTNTQYWISYNTATGGTSGHSIAIGTYQGKIAIWYGGTVDNSFFTSISNNIWYHITLTISENKKAILYINGEQIYSKTFTATQPASQWITLGARSNSATGGVGGASYYYNGLMNDFRFYDHCLSKQEVKEISQGLILHYKLDGALGGVGENLAYGTNTADTSTNLWGLSLQTGGTTRSIEYENNVPIAVITRNDVEHSGWAYLWYSNIHGAEIKSSTTYTISFDIKTSVDGTISFTGLLQGNATNYKTKSTTTINGTCIANKWCHLVYNCVTKDDFTDINNSQVIYLSPSASLKGTGVTLKMKNMKMEESTFDTPWVPAITETNINTSIIKDSSGYNNNGVQNNISIISNSSRYNYSALFNGSNSYIKTESNNWMPQGAEALTVNLWAKATTWPTNGGKLVSCTEAGGFNLEAGNSGYWRFPIYVFTNAEKTTKAYKYDSNEIQISALTPNAWNMITLVYDTTGTKTYINGQLHHTYTNTSYGISFNTSARLFLGCEANVANPSSPFFNGQESDFRIYATALSAEDIKLLYDTPTLINKQAGWHTFMNNEDNRNEISKNGLVHSSEISEASFAEYLKYDSNIYFEPDGSAWIHIYHHNNPSAGSFASNDTFTTSVYKDVDRWFNATQICNNIDKWEFLIKYAYTAGGTEYKERWIQTRNPETAVFGDVDAADITRITGNGYKTGGWGGLYRKNSSAYWVMNNGNSGNWWGAVGSFSIYQGGIPGYGGTVTTTGFNDLYVRIDNVDFLDTDEAKITKNGIYVGNNFVER